ncbi:SCO3870 family protein [Streptomyces sp. NPDC057367]
MAPALYPSPRGEVSSDDWIDHLAALVMVAWVRDGRPHSN